MWRWLHSLPRTLRQHFGCSQSASAGICVDPDKNEDEGPPKEKCKNKTSWRQHCKYSSNDDKANHKDQSAKNEPHNFWKFVQGPGPVVEAIGVGGVIALGIQLSHFKCLHRKYRAPEERKKHCLLYKVAYALPTLHESPSTTRRNITSSTSATEKKKDTKENKEQEQPKVPTLDEAFSQFEHLCQKYTATGKSIMGHQEASAGNLAAAASLWAESSLLGHSKAQFNLAVCYETGQGVKRNMDEAVKYYKLAAEDEHLQAMYNLAMLYLEGTPHVPRDTDQGLTLLTKAADRGLVDAQRSLGVYYTEEGSEDMAMALKYIQMAAEQQDEESQYNLGQCYEHGIGVKQDTCRAASLYSQAADSGHTEAMYSLAVFHLQGKGGLAQDRHSVSSLLQRAANLGHQEAQQELEKLTICDQPIQSDQHHQSTGTYLLRLNSSVSTPCLTEYLRGNIIQVGPDMLYDPVSNQGTLSQIYSQLVTPRGVTHIPTLTQVSDHSNKKSSRSRSVSRSDSDSDSGVVFSLGFEESDHHPEEIRAISTVKDVNTISQVPIKALMPMQRRTSTMPELLSVCV